MASKWFAAKTLYRSDTNGPPQKPDKYYDPDATMMEERIVLIKAKNKPEALTKAEREARDFAAKAQCVNPYQQKITTRYTGYCDIFELTDSLQDKTELFIKDRVISRRIKDFKMAQIYIGKREGHYEHSSRKKFINQDYRPENA